VDPDVYAKSLVLQPIRGFAVRRIGDRPATARFDRVVSHGIRRCEFDAHLLARCEARVFEGEPLRSLERDGEAWVVNGRWRTPLVVGAGGHFCPVARRLATGPKADEPIVAAQEVEFRLPPDADCPVDPEIPELFFSRDLRGYGWVFRKGQWLNVGLGRQDKEHLSEQVESFVRFLREEGRLPAELPATWQGHAYLLYDHAPRRLVGDGLALVGDAAGLAYPRSGEGIRPAVESALLLARSLAGAASTREALARYEASLLAHRGRREPGVGWTDLLPAGLTQRLAGWLLARPAFARRVVVERWFVHAHEAPVTA
jgi:flavin-dependent dehydrogenase